MIARRWRPLAAAMLLAGLFSGPALGGPADEGRLIFEGRASLSGRLTGHTTALPVAASRCVNCHRRDTAPPVAAGASASDSRSFGPLLSSTDLIAARPRRGGPPSSYDANSMCRLLQDGIDPAWIIIDRSMPRYTISLDECQLLWAYLSVDGGVR